MRLTVGRASVQNIPPPESHKSVFFISQVGLKSEAPKEGCLIYHQILIITESSGAMQRYDIKLGLCKKITVSILIVLRQIVGLLTQVKSKGILYNILHSDIYLITWKLLICNASRTSCMEAWSRSVHASVHEVRHVWKHGLTIHV